MLKKIITICVLALCQTSYAGGLAISPIDPVIEQGQQATSLWLTNHGDTVTVLQIRVLGWHQANFDDQYEEMQQSVIASPPMATIAPGKKQLVRLIKNQMVAPNQEAAYRILIDEITPAASASMVTNKKVTSLQFQMRYSIPLFVAGEGIRLKEDSIEKISATLPKLSAQWIMLAGKKYLQIHNTGNIHARLSNVRSHHVKETMIHAGLLGYVLPNATMRWPVPMAAGGQIKAKINDVMDVIIPVL